MSQALTISTFTLENGTTLRDVPVAYRTWGMAHEDGVVARRVERAPRLVGDRDLAKGGSAFEGEC